MLIKPNTLTVSRLIMTFVFIVAILQDGLFFKALGTFVFCLAVVTDFYDGYLARKHDMISDFGKLMDPIADKFLMLAAFLIFTKLNVIAVWMFFVIFAREILITAMRLYAKEKGKIIAAENFGRYKTALQMVTAIVILFFILYKETPLYGDGSYTFASRWQLLIDILMYVVVYLTIASGFSCVWNNRHLYSESTFN